MEISDQFLNRLQRMTRYLKADCNVIHEIWADPNRWDGDDRCQRDAQTILRLCQTLRRLRRERGTYATTTTVHR